jgi:phospholipid-binding lipoprotein MlaA
MRFSACAAVLAAACVLGGCATAPAGRRDPRDPLERVNRSVFRFNTAADHAVFRPAAKAWKAVVPPPVRNGLGNFVANLEYPVTIVNDVLQGKFSDGGQDLTRLLVNTVFGFGFFDPATHAGLERHDEDFGQTLGKWGVPSGPYLVIPLLGPSSIRDAPAKLADEYANGRHYLSDRNLGYGLWVTSKLELRAGLLDADAVLEHTYDPYAFVRNAWLQRREYQVRDGAVDEPAVDTGEDTPAN